MEFDAALPVLIGIAAVHLLAVASPGPTMAVVTTQALSGDRRTAMLVAAGVLWATLIWSSLAAAGLGAVLKSSPYAYRTLQYVGAAYLFYLGTTMLVASYRARSSRRAANDNADIPAPREMPGDFAAFRTGFITNITNPNTIAYFAALFGVLVPTDASRTLFWSAVVIVLSISTLWWICVVLFFSQAAVRRVYDRIRPVADVVMGLMLVGIGVRLAVGG
jgi:threonine efflux protein